MHIHHGMGAGNPVERLRFFPKNASDNYIAQPLELRTYQSKLPRQFEDRKLRLFCRSRTKAKLAADAFAKWCEKQDTHTPFPSQSQQQVIPAEEEEEGLFDPEQSYKLAHGENHHRLTPGDYD
jgi:hypothetical protein